MTGVFLYLSKMSDENQEIEVPSQESKSDEYLKSLERLRGLRLSAGLTLKQVEIKSREIGRAHV